MAFFGLAAISDRIKTGELLFIELILGFILLWALAISGLAESIRASDAAALAQGDACDRSSFWSETSGGFMAKPFQDVERIPSDRLCGERGKRQLFGNPRRTRGPEFGYFECLVRFDRPGALSRHGSREPKRNPCQWWMFERSGFVPRARGCNTCIKTVR